MPSGCTLRPRYFSTASGKSVDVHSSTLLTREIVEVGGGRAAPQSEATPPPNTAPEQHVRDDVEQDVKVMLAEARDDGELLEREAGDLARALVLSKPETIREDLVLLRFVKRARSPQVVQALLEAPELERCRRLVSEAGRDLRPEWAGGAWVLAPLSESELFAIMEESPDLVLKDSHVLMRSCDVRVLRRALGRATIATEVQVFSELPSAQASADSQLSVSDDAGEDRDFGQDDTSPVLDPQNFDDQMSAHLFTIERTFITVREAGLEAASRNTAPGSAPF